MVHCADGGMDMVSKNTQVGFGIERMLVLAIMGPKCAKKISIPLPAGARTIDGRQDGSMLSCCLVHMLSRLSERGS